jgi:hypothetical protein
VTTPFGESANNEFLSKAGADPLRGTDCEIPKDKTNSAIRSGKIKIRETSRCQIATQAGVIWH